MSLFIAREVRMRVDIRRKEKIEKMTEFAERMKIVQEKTGTTLKKAQEKIKWKADKRRKEAEK